MIGLGTILNTAAIVAGGILGALFGRFLHDSAQDTLTKVCGVSTLFIAITGALEEMLRVENGRVVSSGSMLIIGCLAVGALIGEWLNIEGVHPRELHFMPKMLSFAETQCFLPTPKWLTRADM